MSMERELKYGCNPNQSPASISLEGKELPLSVLNGAPGYINLLDAFNGWQLVKELRAALNMPAAASYKHTSPAGAAVGLPLNEVHRKMYFVEQDDISPLCAAYIRARGADRLSSFGDFVALSDVCDVSTARYLLKEVSDGVIAPGYEAEALDILKQKRKGGFTVLKIDPDYEPETIEKRQMFGITFTQKRNGAHITGDILTNIVTKNKELTQAAKRDLIVAMITLKYTQSNSVCYAEDGQAIGVGAGQQSRIHCTRLAGNKADLWHLRQHPAVIGLPFKEGLGRPIRDNAIDLYLMDEEPDEAWAENFTTLPKQLTKEEKEDWLKKFDRAALASDAFFPFGDNIERAQRSGVKYIAQPGGSIRDDNVIACCDKFDMVMAFTGMRLFYH
ncbi:phosphoribosylaminoimidazolecarboxamide formyltransferase [Christensenellaceae bacterium OttesenSCG-928-M15]|nr:phosphoribosylaminoimidazolecarboxamide formyltransferase [Christensenellaceae bacterium OttesenSCG-928-M15]